MNAIEEEKSTRKKGNIHFGKSFMHEAKMANGYKYRLRLIFLQTKEKLNANFFQKCMARAGYSRV